MVDQINPSENFHSVIIDEDEKVSVAKGHKVEEPKEMEQEESFNEIQKTPPQKETDPGAVILPISIGYINVQNALIDMGSSVNLIPLTIVQKIDDL